MKVNVGRYAGKQTYQPVRLLGAICCFHLSRSVYFASHTGLVGLLFFSGQNLANL